MTIHRATTASGSAAEACFRSDAHSTYHYIPNYDACDIPVNPNAIRALPHRQLPLQISLKYPQHHPNDPTRPLLQTTRHHTLSFSSTLPAPPSSSPASPVQKQNNSAPSESTPYDSDHYRMGIKSPSGTYIGLICIALVWLLPIGIIASGGTAGEIAAKASSFFGQPVQEPLSDPLPNPLQPLIWENLKRGEHCLRYKTREYTAKSVGQNRGPAAMEECRRSRAQIHDIELRPTFCENLGTWSGIWGHWVVDFDEPDCETSWTTFEDQGCQVTTGSHRFTAKLDRWNRKDNWLIMCSTTPAEHTLHEKKLPVPSRCERVKDVVIGTWDVPDRSCLPVSTPAS